MTDDVMTLPKIYFQRSTDGILDDEGPLVRVVDRHGVDVTNLFLIQDIGLSLGLFGLAQARLVFLAKGWNIDSPDGVVEATKVRNDDGYKLMDNIQPNSVKELYPRQGNKMIEITFDAEWEK